ncbi:MAG TPA: SAM-dependent chlorinase/fluorinase [Kofleriaceae bacterium]|jgi:hypothetical protein
MPIITLTTDFGTRDGYVGAMKGVIARLTPQATVYDLAHDIPRGDIAHAAWVVAQSTREFPRKTVHVCVVDPGVGGPRQSVVVKARHAWYVGPDNGVFAYVTDAASQAWSIEDARFRNATVSPTFHGRDVFAYAAALLAGGEDVVDVGPAVTLLGRLPWAPRAPGRGCVVHIDCYGNLITNLPGFEAEPAIAIAGVTLPLVRTYTDVLPGELLAYIGSAGTVEIALRDGRADERLGTPRGTIVQPVATLPEPYR